MSPGQCRPGTLVDLVLFGEARMRALVVDDSSTVRKIVSSILQKLGYECLQAGNGQEALTVVREHPDITLAMVDWNMPVMNGLEFVLEVRKSISTEKMKVIMVTTETELRQVSAALDAGVDEYIMKPFTPEIVEEKLRMAGVELSSS
jgi:two-component system chemotaxis response regulator CheY